MALEKDGKLYIFELKAWESHSQNILQALRYGQLFGCSCYDALNELFGKFGRSGISLKEAHRARFEVALDEGEFNRAQVFVVMTNGLDCETREAIQYWRAQKLVVRTWVYRVYESPAGEMLLEVSPFTVQDNPYEDAAEGYYILSTNYGNHPQDHDDMVNNGKTAAYFAPPKYKIERLSRGDVIFLYQTGVGIVATGVASGKLEKYAYHGDPQYQDEEYCMQLDHFIRLPTPLPAAKIKQIAGRNYSFHGDRLL